MEEGGRTRGKEGKEGSETEDHGQQLFRLSMSGSNPDHSEGGQGLSILRNEEREAAEGKEREMEGEGGKGEVNSSPFDPTC